MSNASGLGPPDPTTVGPADRSPDNRTPRKLAGSRRVCASLERVRFVSRKCTACGLLFPVDDASTLGRACPHCHAPTDRIGPAYDTEPVRARIDRRPHRRLEGLLDNVRSLTNVGSMFRCADGVGMGHLHLCGFTPTPAHPKLKKTALGAEASVPWSHHADAVVAAEYQLAQGKRLWAIEGGPRSESLYDLDLPNAAPEPLVLVFGHEVSGVDPRLVDRCERVVRIPMRGIKGSLNVSVAFGIAAYHLAYAHPSG
ncbi:MAG: RNA methyltransferase [Myxococcales bacterium FL481]|nr:MAG: RNA methyltransferase [Myxococcales bacterium FL481]